MNCNEARDLIPLLVLDSLDPHDRSALETRLAECTHCQGEVDLARAAFDRVDAETDEALQPLSGDLRDNLMAQVHRESFTVVEDAKDQAKKKGAATALSQADPAKVEAVAQRISLICIYCHGSTHRAELAFCSGCLAPHHADCFTDNGQCSAPGCEERETVRPGRWEPYRQPRRGSRGILVGVLAGALTAAAAGAAAYTGMFVRPLETPPRSAEEIARQEELKGLSAREIARLEKEKTELEGRIAGLTKVAPETGDGDWILRFSTASEAWLQALRAGIERGDHENVEGCLDQIETLCWETLQSRRSDPREARSMVRELLAQAEQAFPKPVAFARLLSSEDPRVDAGRLVSDELQGPRAEALSMRINVDLDGTDLADVMEQIGRQVGRNILVDPNVDEVVRVSLRDIPWREAVDVIARMTRCDVEERPGGIILLTQPPKVTIQFTDANVRTVLQLLAAYSGKNIIIDPDIVGNVTLDLKEVHWLRALHAIVKTVGDFVVVEESEDLLRVVTRKSFEQRIDEPVDLAASIAKLRGLNAPSGRLIELKRERISLAELVAAIGRQAENTITLHTGEAQVFLTVTVERAPWPVAIRAVAKAAEYELFETTDGAVLRKTQQNALQAFRAPVKGWLDLLARAGEFEVEIADSPWEHPAVTLDLERIGYERAAERTLRAIGWAFTWREGRLRVTPKKSELSSLGYRSTPIPVSGGHTHPLALQATIVGKGQGPALVLISGRVYAAGDALGEGEQALPLKVQQIESRQVLLAETTDEATVHPLKVRFKLESTTASGQ